LLNNMTMKTILKKHTSNKSMKLQRKSSCVVKGGVGFMNGSFNMTTKIIVGFFLFFFSFTNNVDASCYSAWNSSTIYYANNYVSYAGKNFRAKNWTQNNTPNCGQWCAWEDLGACCVAAGTGSLTTPAAICSGSSTTIAGSAVSGAAYQWMKEGTYGANNWAVLGGNVQSLNTGALTAKTRFVRRTYKCSPAQYSGWVYVTVSVFSTANNPGIVSVPATSCAGATITTVNNQSASTGSPASSVPTYYHYYRGGPSNIGWQMFWSTTQANTNLPTAVSNTPGTWFYARNSAFACTGQTNNGNTLNKQVIVYSTSNNPGAISVPAAICQGTAVTVTNVTSASQGTPASSAPMYRHYYRGGPSNVGWTMYLYTSSPTATLPTAVTNTPGQWYLARNSYFTCGAGANNGTTLDIPIRVDATSALGSPSTAGPVNFCDAGGNFGTPVTVSGQTGSVTWNYGKNNGWWSGTWGSFTTSSGVNTFPKLTTNPSSADRIRYKVTNGVCPTVTSSAILISTYHNNAPSSIISNINNVCPSTAGTLTATFPGAVNMRGKVEFATTINGAAFASITPTAGQTVFTTNVAPTATTTYYVRYSGIINGGASCYSSSQSVVVTVTPNRTVAAASSSPTVCISTAMTNVTHATTGVLTVGTSSGLPTGVTASYTGNVITLSGTPTASGTFNYTITPTSACGSAAATGTITVTANRTVAAASSSPTLCISTAMTNVTHATIGVTAVGTSSGLPTGVTASYTGNVITISGTPSQSGTFNYTITPSGCGSATATGVITVSVNRTVSTASSSPTTCINTAMTSITHVTTGVAAVGTSSGLPAGVTASYTGNVITLSGTPSATGIFSYTITPSGCGSATATGTITVTAPRTVGTASSAPTLCINTAMTSITHATTGVTAVGTSSGLPAGVTASYTGDVITLSGTPTASGTFNYTITPSGCGSAAATGTIVVDAAAVGGSISSANTECYGDNGATLTLTGYTGTITKWQYSIDNWTTPVDIVNATATETYSNLTVTRKYRAVVRSGACAAGTNSSDVTITVSNAATGGVISW
jgi:hypothetical protein